MRGQDSLTRRLKPSSRSSDHPPMRGQDFGDTEGAALAFVVIIPYEGSGPAERVAAMSGSL